MTKKNKDLGRVKLVQIQPSGLIIEFAEGEIYDPSRRVEVDSLFITSLGIEANNSEGERVLDIHHINHPDKAYDSKDLISIGFTSHYEAMMNRFGKHMVYGIAGENIIIEYDKEIWVEDLGEQVVIESAKTGKQTHFEVDRFSTPCFEFSHFAANSQHEKLPTEILKSTLQFLNNGRRGFLLVMSEGQEEATVQAGDRVFTMASTKEIT